MQRRHLSGVLTVALVILNACARVPVAPSGTTAATGAGTRTPAGGTAGIIELRTDQPDGATLTVNPCPGESNPIPCSDDLQLRFSVVVNRDIERARVWTEFYNAAGQLCAGASTPFVALTADIPAQLTGTSVYLSLQGSETSICGLPMQTTRMVAHLYDWASPRDVLTQNFSNTYTFTDR